VFASALRRLINLSEQQIEILKEMERDRDMGTLEIAKGSASRRRC